MKNNYFSVYIYIYIIYIYIYNIYALVIVRFQAQYGQYFPSFSNFIYIYI